MISVLEWIGISIGVIVVQLALASAIGYSIWVGVRGVVTSVIHINKLEEEMKMEKGVDQ